MPVLCYQRWMLCVPKHAEFAVTTAGHLGAVGPHAHGHVTMVLAKGQEVVFTRSRSLSTSTVLVQRLKLNLVEKGNVMWKVLGQFGRLGPAALDSATEQNLASATVGTRPYNMVTCTVWATMLKKLIAFSGYLTGAPVIYLALQP